MRRLDSFFGESIRSAKYYKNATIEHVLPQIVNKKNISWYKDQNLDESTKEKWVNRIGNLVLLSRRKNSSAQNYDLKTKQDVYFKKGNTSTIYPITTTVSNAPTWTINDVKTRQKSYLRKFIATWNFTISEKQLDGLIEE